MDPRAYRLASGLAEDILKLARRAHLTEDCAILVSEPASILQLSSSPPHGSWPHLPLGHFSQKILSGTGANVPGVQVLQAGMPAPCESVRYINPCATRGRTSEVKEAFPGGQMEQTAVPLEFAKRPDTHSCTGGHWSGDRLTSPNAPDIETGQFRLRKSQCHIRCSCSAQCSVAQTRLIVHLSFARLR